MSDDLMDTSLVCKLAGFSRRTLYRLMHRGTFPLPIPDTSGHKKPTALFWLATVILEWVCKHNPMASEGKIIDKNEIAKQWNFSYGRVNVLSKKPGFPKAATTHKGADFYNADEVNEWMKVQRFRKKKTKKVVL